MTLHTDGEPIAESAGLGGRRLPARSVRPEPRVPVLLARTRADRPRVLRARAHLLAARSARSCCCRRSRRSACCPCSSSAIVLLVAVRRVVRARDEAPGLGMWSARGDRRPRRSGAVPVRPPGGVRVSPCVIVAGRRRVAGSSASWSRRRSRCGIMPGRAGRGGGRRAATASRSPAAWTPSGVVRVAAEEWSASRSGGPCRRRTRSASTTLDGLVLAVEPSTPSTTLAGGARRPEKEDTDVTVTDLIAIGDRRAPGRRRSCRKRRSRSSPSTSGSWCSGWDALIGDEGTRA